MIDCSLDTDLESISEGESEKSASEADNSVMNAT